MRGISAAILGSVLVFPAVVSGQSAESSPAVEVAPLVNFLAGINGNGVYPMPTVGVRTSGWLSSRVSVQADVRFLMTHASDGLYGIRVRYVPRPDASSWFVFGGLDGRFQLPVEYEFRGPRDALTRYRRPGGIWKPTFPSGGVGYRVPGRNGWSVSIEAEVWVTPNGAIAVGAGVDVARGLGRVVSTRANPER